MPDKILIVDDSNMVRKTLRRHLTREDVELEEAVDGQDALEKAATFLPDLMVLDVMMPRLDGIEVAKRVKADPKLSYIYIIMLTAMREVQDEVKGLDSGADDYVTKPFNPETLMARIHRGLRVSREKSAATRDPLTGLGNRRAFDAALAHELARIQRSGSPLSLIMCDIDHFKRVNDTLGHETGDLVLKELAEIIKGNCRELDVPARFGGEEFVIILPDTALEGALLAAERLRASVEAHVFPGAGHVTVSLGVAQASEHPEDLVKESDQAMYAAKQSGRNRVCVARAVP
jgi:two-component system, cell cycle response regulator